MGDRYGVVQALTDSLKNQHCGFVEGIGDVYAVSKETINDTLNLLKDQEPMPMIEVEDDDLYAWSPEDVSYYCPRPECGKEISYNYNFCPYCEQAVKMGWV